MRKLALALLLAALLLGMVVIPAFAAIHPIASSECANANGSDVANLQDPPGQTPGDGPGDGKGDLKGVINSLTGSGGKSANGNSGAANCPNA